jgi:DNA-binding NarL/FixJ family response regulator
MQERAAPSFKVFLVEDAPVLRTRIEDMLASIPGAEVTGHAADAPSAISGILAARPDAVVLDIHLSQGSGFDVLRAVRAELPRTRFYVLTNFASTAYRQVAERLGASGFYDKSNEFESLKAALASAGKTGP